LAALAWLSVDRKQVLGRNLLTREPFEVEWVLCLIKRLANLCNCRILGMNQKIIKMR
jgi:hypothetical protein